jgi:hypothetical protein
MFLSFVVHIFRKVSSDLSHIMGQPREKRGEQQKIRCNQVNERQGSIVQYLLPRQFS